MTITKEDLEKIVYPKNKRYPREMYEFLVQRIQEDPSVFTTTVARVWANKSGLGQEDLRKIRIDLDNFRSRYFFLNEISGIDRHAKRFR